MSPRPQIDHIRKPQILAAAAEVIAERGIAATRIADVAERAGTSAPAVLYWFDSRDELLAEALRFAEDAFYAELSERLEELDSPRGRLAELIAASTGGDDWKLWMELWTRALRDPAVRDERQRLDDRWREQIAAIVREGQEAGEFGGPDPNRIALELAALIDGLAVQVTLGDEFVSAEVMGSTCLEVGRAPRGLRAGGVGVSDLSRRQLLRAGAGLALGAYGLAGCTVERPLDIPEAGRSVKPGIDGDLLIYNWAQYMDPDIKKRFSEKYGVEVNEVNFDNLEAMVIKLRSGAQYDLIWPSTEYVYRLRAEGLLARFDPNALRNRDKVSSFYDHPWWDPNAEYGVPYTYYTTGICWREDQVSGMTGSWADLSNPDGAGRMFILDDFQEAIGEANLLNGFDLNTEDPNELEISKQTLLDQKETARGFSTNSVQNLVSGTAVLHQAWNGDIVNVRNQVDDPELFQYETCKEGVPVGTDLMSIPVNARSPGTALDLHRLDPRARERRPERRLERISATVRGRQGGVRQAGQDRAVDRRRPRAARRRRPGVPARRPRGPPALDPGLHGGQGDVVAGPFWNRFILPGAVWLLVLFAIPCALVLALSFGYVDDLGRAVYSTQLDNYSDAFDPTYVPVLIRSVLYALATTALCFAIGYPVAYYIAIYGGRYRHVLIALLVLPFFVNYLVRTYAWVALLADEGLVNNGLTDLGIIGSPIQMINTPWAVIGGLTYGYLIFMILPVYGSIERLDRSVIEAGKDLYGTPLRTFLNVTLPMTKQGILAGSVLVFLPSVGDFVAAQLLGGPDTYMVGNLIQDQFFAANNWPFGAALTVVMMLFLAIWMVGYLRSAARDVRGAAI